MRQSHIGVFRRTETEISPQNVPLQSGCRGQRPLLYNIRAEDLE